jgi:sulfatase modifying factor 1
MAIVGSCSSGPGPAQPPLLTANLGDGVVIDFVRIHAGNFQMGSPATEKDRLPDETLHDVQITRDFYVGKCEVTRGQFGRFVKETGYLTEAERDGEGGWGYDKETRKIAGRKPAYTWKFAGFDQTDEHPVVNVTWNDADAFCKWLTKKTGMHVRLPTEAEWEYAGRAGSSTDESLVTVGNVADATARKEFEWAATVDATDGYLFTAPCGQFLANRFGLYDMHGNVWEWVQDWYGPYESLSAKDPVQEAAVPDAKGRTYRVMRGGSFGKRTPRNPSLTRRVGGAPGSRDIDLGFRVAVAAPAQ